MTKFRIWLFKWSARLMGGEAVWVKDNNTGRVYNCVAYKIFDPFKDGRQDLVIKGERGHLYTLNVDNGKMNGHNTIWRYVDESKHVEQILKQK